MSRISTTRLKPGMKVERTVYGPRGEILVSSGSILTPPFINKLAEYEVPFVYINDGKQQGTFKRYKSPAARLPKIEGKDLIAKETRGAAIKQVKNILLETKESGRLVIDPQSVYSTVNQFTGEIMSSRDLMFNLVDLRQQDDYTFAHSVNVCVLAMMTGITLGYDSKKLATLGVGALLHDLGKVKIPDEILNKPGRLTREEFSIIKMHTVYGYELIRDSKSMDSLHAIMAYQHHESCDGSGYPAGIKTEKFHDFSQIISIVDKFDALTADRVYRKPFAPCEAYEMCAASGNYLFKDYIVRAFLNNIAAYPTGSIVELNSGYIGVVIDTPKGFSMFPRLRLLYGPDRRQLPVQEEISLLDKEDQFVIRMLPTEEVNSLSEND
ncbi:HD-GYP domain-containing protein [Pelotomaculum propionicicum]|uniref:HD-GYP domain-containing protein n=1 Tax=Pelotomaculum propionicicum TaxID=258475 RepID=UPI003B7D32A2